MTSFASLRVKFVDAFQSSIDSKVTEVVIAFGLPLTVFFGMGFTISQL